MGAYNILFGFILIVSLFIMLTPNNRFSRMEIRCTASTERGAEHSS